MNAKSRIRLIQMLEPLILGPYWVIRVIYVVLFGWWLNPWQQRRSNQSLWDEVQANLYFLYSEGRPIIEKRPHPLPFDYASVRILFGNIYFRFTRGRGELNVTLAPRHEPTRSHELSLVLTALDSCHFKPLGSDWKSIAGALRPRLDALNKVFSEALYPEFVEKIP
ncbi:MAG: hypothetical protein WB729_17625 [Candidatus Sulfotelmatobacter sp.]